MLIQFQEYLTFENIYLWTNFGILPFWLMLIIIPNSKFTTFFVNSVILPLILSTAYIYVVYQAILLEEAILDFSGCVVVISHDRWFLNKLATHILAFEGDSHVEWFEGNYQDYENDKKRRLGEDSLNPKRIKYKPITR